MSTQQSSIEQQPAEGAFPTNYTEIIDRINGINPLHYAETRNYTNGAVTYLSPYISRGIVSVKQIREAVLQKGYKPWQIQKFTQELAWREYFQRVWQHVVEGIWQDLKQPQQGVLQHEMPVAVHEACTGIKAIDQAISTLYSTGYMHNHLRMYLASLVCNIAKTYWTQPARWLYYHLLDGDVASNNCSWQWVAGAFSSKQYYFNQENVNRFTAGSQRATFLDHSYEHIESMAVPGVLQQTGTPGLHTILPHTPPPQLDTRKQTLIYNSYNLDVNWRSNEDVNRILLLEPSHFKQYPVSEKVIQFVIALSRNIPGIAVVTGEIELIVGMYEASGRSARDCIVSKEHPAFQHYPGSKDSRHWLYPEVTGYYPSFSAFYKNCEKQKR